MGLNTAKLKWNTGTLKEAFLCYPKGAIVAFRLYSPSRPLAAGVCWVIRVQGHRIHHMVAESYGGVRLCSLVQWKVNPETRKPIESNPEITASLNKAYREWQLKLPAGARRFHPDVSDQMKVKLRSLQNTVNI